MSIGCLLMKLDGLVMSGGVLNSFSSIIYGELSLW